MQNKNYFRIATAFVALFVFIIGCNTPAAENEKPVEAATAPKEVKPDAATIKAEIQALETAWATADNARDVNAIAAFYSDDAISYSNNKPMVVGRAAIQKDIEEGFVKRPKGSTVAYDVVDVYAGDNTATETGKITRKDEAGKVTYTGKYMAVWEKHNGKYICIRDISNDDAKEK